jgi:CheY-like chemotaxis protein
LEVLTRLKNDPELNLIPVVIFTSSRELNDSAPCASLGVEAFIQKPIDSDEFIATIRNIGARWG